MNKIIQFNSIQCGCSARLKTSFELNPVTDGKQWTFPFLSWNIFIHGDKPAKLSYSILITQLVDHETDNLRITNSSRAFGTDQYGPSVHPVEKWVHGISTRISSPLFTLFAPTWSVVDIICLFLLMISSAKLWDIWIYSHNHVEFLVHFLENFEFCFNYYKYCIMYILRCIISVFIYLFIFLFFYFFLNLSLFWQIYIFLALTL